jgi:hypothetical protein
MRICKKNPFWRGDDVKEPGPYCKRRCHKHIWLDRPALHKKDGGAKRSGVERLR